MQIRTVPAGKNTDTQQRPMLSELSGAQKRLQIPGASGRAQYRVLAQTVHHLQMQKRSHRVFGHVRGGRDVRFERVIRLQQSAAGSGTGPAKNASKASSSS
jgi:hypothetical protein